MKLNKVSTMLMIVSSLTILSPVANALEKCHSFFGTWSTNFGYLTIGNDHKGTYTYKTSNGEVTGKTTGNAYVCGMTYVGTWEEVFNGKSTKGSVAFLMNRDGRSFNGVYTRSSPQDKFGVWNGSTPKSR